MRQRRLPVPGLVMRVVAERLSIAETWAAHIPDGPPGGRADSPRSSRSQRMRYPSGPRALFTIERDARSGRLPELVEKGPRTSASVARLFAEGVTARLFDGDDVPNPAMRG
jgi:hypothetical protein